MTTWKSSLRKFVFKNYVLLRAHDAIRREFFELIDNRPPIFIYSIGKTGTTTINTSLLKCGFHNVFKAHTLDMNLISERLEKRRKSRSPINLELIHGIYINKKISENAYSEDGKDKLNIFTGVRDPIATHIASYFQNVNKMHPGIFEDYDKGKISLEEFIDLYFSFSKSQGENPSLNWFDEELKRYFDIDVFETEFPKEQGYKIYSNGPVKALVFKLEGLNDIASEAFNQFLNIDDFHLSRANLGSDKKYKHIYKAFLSQIKFDSSSIENCYGSKYVRHFYSEKEIDEFRHRWL